MGATHAFLFRLSVLLLLCQAGCVNQFSLLNSERIARKFGNYAIEVIETKDNILISNLYSAGPDGPVCRTIAIVRLPGRTDPRYQTEHELIGMGASTGQVFRSHGWEVQKRHRHIGDLEIDAEAEKIARLMRIRIPTSVAIHSYVFRIARDGQSLDYATITELHHPEYLSSAELRTIYGRDYSAPRVQDEVREALALLSRTTREPGQ